MSAIKRGMTATKRTDEVGRLVGKVKSTPLSTEAKPAPSKVKAVSTKLAAAKPASAKPILAKVVAIPTLNAKQKQALLTVLDTTVNTNHAIGYMKKSLGDMQAEVIGMLIASGHLDAKLVKVGSTKELAPLIKAGFTDTDTFFNNKGEEQPHGKYATSRAVCLIAAYNKRHNVKVIDGKETITKTNAKGEVKHVAATIPKYHMESAKEGMSSFLDFLMAKKSSRRVA